MYYGILTSRRCYQVTYVERFEDYIEDLSFFINEVRPFSFVTESKGGAMLEVHRGDRLFTGGWLLLASIYSEGKPRVDHLWVISPERGLSAVIVIQRP